MTNPPDVITEVYLRPGDCHFGDRNTRIRTLLGSCVSLVLWHPRARLGGMCHFMLPTRGQPAPQLDGRYGDEAMELLRHAISASSPPTQLHEYQVRIIGGGHMFPALATRIRQHIGLHNIEMARRLVKEHGLNCHGEHVGGIGHRSLIFDIWNGQLALKHATPTSPPGPTGAQSA